MKDKMNIKTIVDYVKDNIFAIIFISIILVCLYMYSNTESKYQLSDKLTEKDIQYLNYGQRVMTDILREFDRICRKYDLKYWCIGGTLIGAIRHKGWIPHDGDVDIAITENDYHKLKTIIVNELPETMYFQTPKQAGGYAGKIRDKRAGYVDWDLDHVQLDIFIVKEKENILIPTYKYSDTFDGGTPHNRNMIFPLRETMFEDIKVYIPNQTEKYSTNSWGEYPPKLLPIKDRFPHEGKIVPL
uniref:LicD/FKTN/FKRP nucleotidyltransferase domain-containing protein n=1 Tax=viral metagenome TaxID=1070528 RepID=A0A6C0FBY0_9ZZZZ|tara:strand:- start:4644 stop:5372 length:729 start_codon:yes stop_codon:yes gene_type:complete